MQWQWRNLPKSVLCACSEFFLISITIVVATRPLLALPLKTIFLICDDFAWKTDDLMENARRNRHLQTHIQRLTWLMWRVRLLQSLNFHQWWHSSNGNQPWIYMKAKCPSLLRGRQHFSFSNWTFRSELPPSSLTSTWNFAAPVVTAFNKKYWQKRRLTLKVRIEKRLPLCSQMYLQYQQINYNFWYCKNLLVI